MTLHSLAPWLSAVRAADRDTLRLLAAITHVLPWWGRDAAALVRGGPVVALLLWTLAFLLLPPAARAARASHVRALAGGVLAGTAWAIAWAALGLGPYLHGFAPAAAAEASVAALPLGAALLALGAGDGGGALGTLLRALAVAYALARLAIGADGPLRVLAEAASAAAVSLLLAHAGPLRAWADDVAERVGRALGLAARGSAQRT